MRNGLFLVTGLGSTFSKDRDIHNLDRLTGMLGRRRRMETGDKLVPILRYILNVTSIGVSGNVWVRDIDDLHCFIGLTWAFAVL